MKITIPRCRVFLRKHDSRCIRLKLIVTATFFAAFAAQEWLAVHLAIAGNLIWLWADFE